MRKKNFEWKLPAMLCAGWFVVLVIAKIISSSNEFKVVHNAAIESTVGKDGRAAVGAPESYTVWISPKGAHELMSGGTKVLAVIAWVVFACLVIYIFAVANDIITFAPNSSSGTLITYGLLALCVAFSFAGYSSIFADTFRDLTPAEYEAVKGDSEKLLNLFK